LDYIYLCWVDLELMWSSMTLVERKDILVEQYDDDDIDMTPEIHNGHNVIYISQILHNVC